jgi:hypothetical protein
LLEWVYKGNKSILLFGLCGLGGVGVKAHMWVVEWAGKISGGKGGKGGMFWEYFVAAPLDFYRGRRGLIGLMAYLR